MSAASARPAARLRPRVAPRWRALVLVEALWVLFVANFSVLYLWGGDAQVPYTFLRRLFGAHVHADGYQFGLALFEAPAYAVGRVFEIGGLRTILTHPTNQVAIALGAAVYIGASVAMVYVLLQQLGLPPGWAAGLALFGSPLFYFGTFSPGQTHAVDAFLATGAVCLTYVGWQRGWADRWAIGVGVVLGTAATVRYLEGALGVGLVVALLAYRRTRPAVVVAAVAGVTLGLLLLLPVALGVHLFGGPYNAGVLAFSPLSPFHMLFSSTRGLFVWTPVTLLGAIGYLVVLRERRREHAFYVTAGAMAVALVLAQAVVPFWQAGWSFSQRYLVALFPVIAIGLAGLVRRAVSAVRVLGVIAVAWSMFLCMTMQVVGFDEHHDTAFSLARRAGTQTLGGYLSGVRHLSRLTKIVRGHST